MSVANVFSHSIGLRTGRQDLRSDSHQWSQSRTATTEHTLLTRVLFALSFIALSASGYLASVSLSSGSVAGCGSGAIFDCDHVLHSRWATVLSVPVSVFAVMTHAVFLTSLLARPSSVRWEQARWSVISFAALSAGGAALWFIGLQVFWLQHLCAYCLVAHTCGLMIAGLILWFDPVERLWLRRSAAAAAVSLAGLISLQTMTDPPATYSVVQPPLSTTEVGAEQDILFEAPSLNASSTNEPDTRRDLHSPSLDQSVWLFKEGWSVATAILNPASLVTAQVAGGTARSPGASRPTDSPPAAEPTVKVLNGIKLNANHWPVIGNPDADLIFVELFDYTCPHCQKTHFAIDGAMKKYGDRLAVMVLPVPLNRACNPSAKSNHVMHREACDLARLAIAVWSVDREQFAVFHHYLFEAKPTFAAAQAKAAQMVDRQRLTEAMNGPLPSEYIAKHVALYQKAGAGTVPKLLFPATTIEGEVASAESLSQLIDRHVAAAR